MRKVKNVLVVSILMLFMAKGINAQESDSKKPVVHLQTNAQCSDCKKRLEGELNYVKGIIYAELDLDTKIMEVKYNANKISEEEVKKSIAKVGYDAADVKAEKAAQEKLPACCQPGGHN